jgi:hypothetical protein
LLRLPKINQGRCYKLLQYIKLARSGFGNERSQPDKMKQMDIL